MGALVTVAIPFYNDSAYLDMAIRSVLNQSYKDWRLILLDDGSKDDSLDIAKRYSNDSRIRLISDGNNKGLPARLNEISIFVDTKYYARMDADDIMDPERLEKELAYLEKHPYIDVIGSFAYVIDENNNAIGKIASNIKHPSKISDIFNGGAFVHPSIMGKTKWFQTHPYDIQLRRMQDLALWLSSVEDSYFEIYPEYLLYYRTGKTTAAKYLKTQKYARKFFYSVLLVKEKRLGLFFIQYIKSLVKSVIYIFASVFSCVDKLVRSRYLPIYETEVKFIKNRIKKALASN